MQVRKSLKDLSWDVSEEVYRSDKALSYSTLSRFHKNGPRALISDEKIDTPSLRFGSCVDTILTASEEFDDRFYVADIDKFSDTIRKIIEDIHNSYKEMGWELKETLAESPEAMLLQSLDWAEYQNNWKPETRIKKLIELGSDYYTVLKYSTGKIVISPQEFSDAKQCVNTLKGHRFTYKIFDCNEDEEIFYQLKFKTEINGIPFRFMMDICKVDYKNKTILPIDLKTTGKSEEEFEKSFLSWNYWIQGGAYRTGLYKVVVLDDFFGDFTILPFQFCVINKNSLTPLIWEMSDVETLEFTKNNYGVTWGEILEDANWHLQNGKFNYSRKSYENNGVNPIQLKL